VDELVVGGFLKPEDAVRLLTDVDRSYAVFLDNGRFDDELFFDFECSSKVGPDRHYQVLTNIRAIAAFIFCIGVFTAVFYGVQVPLSVSKAI